MSTLNGPFAGQLRVKFTGREQEQVISKFLDIGMNGTFFSQLYLK